MARPTVPPVAAMASWNFCEAPLPAAWNPPKAAASDNCRANVVIVAASAGYNLASLVASAENTDADFRIDSISACVLFPATAAS